MNAAGPPTLSREGKVYSLWLGDGQNRLDLDWIATVDAHLGEVEASPAPRALVTSASGNCWSTGIDLDWIAANAEKTALARGIIDQLADADDLAGRAMELAETLADKDPATLGAIKEGLYAGLLAQLHDLVAIRLGLSDAELAPASAGE